MYKQYEDYTIRTYSEGGTIRKYAATETIKKGVRIERTSVRHALRRVNMPKRHTVVSAVSSSINPQQVEESGR